MRVTSWAVAGPTFSAQPMSLEGVHSAWARWALGMCSATVDGSPVVAPRVGRHAAALEEDLDGRGGVADLDLLADQLVGHAVGVALDRDVVVDVDAARLPAREDVARGRQGSQGRAVELLVEGAPADAELLHRPVVELVEEDADRPVQSAEVEEGLVAEPGEYPALGQEYAVSAAALSRGFLGRAGTTTAP